MTQNWTDDVFASSHNAQTDLQNMENNFQTLKSLFADSTAPANTVAGIPWFDTGNDLLYIRNAANGSWYGIMHADASQQIWIYRNDAMSGWVMVTTVTDKVLAIKGGSDAYDVLGGTTAGTWTQPSHVLTASEMPSHDHGGGGSSSIDGSHSHNPRCNNNDSDTENPAGNYFGVSTGAYDLGYDSTMASVAPNGDHSHSFSIPSSGGDGSHNHGSTYRPAAAVGTLQKMDV